MKLKYFTETAYYDLFDSISNNKNYYSNSDDSWLKQKHLNQKYCKESRIELALPKFEVDSAKYDDYINAIAIHNAFKDKITRRQASNPYLWSYLTHYEYWDYTVNRWSEEEMSVDKIKKRFFCGTEEGSRIGFLRNSVSRLWWAGELTYQEGKSKPYELTELLFSHSDICQAVLERNFSMNKEITIGILSAIKDINDDPKIENVGILRANPEKYEWGELCKYLNRFGAVTLLDALTSKDIHDISYDYILSLRR